MIFKSEAEARTKWCPMARYIAYAEDGSANRMLSEPANKMCRCIASDCAMWRWLDHPPENRVSGEDKWRGYCGLAHS